MNYIVSFDLQNRHDNPIDKKSITMGELLQFQFHAGG